MAAPLVCSSCQASNPPRAKWCSLCFEPFAAPEPKPAETIEEPPRSVEEVGQVVETPAARVSHGGPPPPPRRAPGPPPPPTPGVAEPPHEVADPTPSGATWTCKFCDTVVPVEETECPACHQSVYDSFGGGDDRIKVEPKVALSWSAIPGGGHFKVGQGVLGLTIGILSVVSLVFGTVLVISRRIPWGAAQLFIGILLWGIAAHDAYRYAEGDTGQVMLRPRILSMVAGLWFVILIAAAISAQGAIPQ